MWRELEALKQELLAQYRQLEIDIDESPGGFDVLVIRHAGKTCSELHYRWKDKNFLVRAWGEKAGFLGMKRSGMILSESCADFAQAKTLLLKTLHAAFG